MQDLESLVARALADFSAAGDPASLENAKAKYLGKSGELAALQSTLRSLAPAIQLRSRTPRPATSGRPES